MRVLTATTCAVLVAAAIATATSTLSAAAATKATSAPNPALTPTLALSEPADPTVQPNPASPGTRVWVYDANECTASHGTATSQALAAPIALAPLASMTGGGGTIREGLAAGTYTVTLHCGSTLTATVHVSTSGTPTGAVAAGDGSAEDHLGVGDAVVGSAFLVGGLAFAAASFIRRRRATTADE